MRGTMRRFILLLIIALSGCCIFITNNISFDYDSLPIAVVGSHYHTQIHTIGLPASDMYIDGKRTTSKNGLTITASNDGKGWYVDISGVPNEKGEVSFNIEGSSVGTQCPGRDFKRKFVIVTMDVNEND